MLCDTPQGPVINPPASKTAKEQLMEILGVSEIEVSKIDTYGTQTLVVLGYIKEDG